MRKFISVAALLLSAGHGSAQQQTPNEQALGTKLMQEIQAGLGCSAGLIGAQEELTKARVELSKAQARIKELEPKPEGK